MNLGMDLGTSRIVICDPARGVVLDEPTVIAIAEKDGHVIAFGTEAEEMLVAIPTPSVWYAPCRWALLRNTSWRNNCCAFVWPRCARPVSPSPVWR
ncbi:MAG: rod shape-determining protein [Clostridia bacterium]|nr:rod shape-determining protein [Clostridia bacterium]